MPWLLPGVRGEVVRLSEELPATLRRADLIFRSESSGSPPTPFLLECQCQADPALPLDLLLRAALRARVLEKIIDLGAASDAESADDRRAPVTGAARRLMLDQAATFATLHLSKRQVQASSAQSSKSDTPCSIPSVATALAEVFVDL